MNRFVAPDGGGVIGDECTDSARPCSLRLVVDFVAQPGDVVSLAPGTYDLGAQALFVNRALHLQGPGTRRAAIRADGAAAAVVNVNAQGATVSDVTIERFDGGLAALAVDGGTAAQRNVVERVYARGGQTGLAVGGVVLASASIATGTATGVLTSQQATDTARLVNVTAVAPTTGISAQGAGTTELVNTIAQGGTIDLAAGSLATVTAAHSNFDTVSGTLVPAPGSGTNQSTPPEFLTPGDPWFRQALTSPTVNAGTTDADAGNVDVYRSAITVPRDIGAQEVRAANIRPLGGEFPVRLGETVPVDLQLGHTTAAIGPAVVRLDVPDGLTVLSAVATNGTYDVDTATWRIDDPTVDTISSTLTLQVRRDAPGDLAIGAVLESVYPVDSTPANNSATLLVYEPTDRFASAAPDAATTGECRTRETACTLARAADTVARDRDTLRLLPGTYTTPLRIDPPFVPRHVTIRGDDPDHPPVLSPGAGHAVDIDEGGDVTLSDLVIRGAIVGIVCTGLTERLTVQRVDVRGPVGMTLTCQVTERLLVRDTIAVGAPAVEVGAAGGDLVGVTAISPDASSPAIAANVPAEIRLRNVIARSPGPDLATSTSGPTSSTIVPRHTNYADKAGDGVPAPSTADGNQTAAPTFVDAAGGDYHQAPTSVTVDAGAGTATDPLVSDRDIDNDVAPRGAGRDIGADELVVPEDLALAVDPGSEVVSLRYGPRDVPMTLSSPQPSGAATVVLELPPGVSAASSHPRFDPLTRAFAFDRLPAGETMLEVQLSGEVNADATVTARIVDAAQPDPDASDDADTVLVRVPRDRFATPGGATSGDCLTQATACALPRAVQTALEGDTVRIASGSYTMEADLQVGRGVDLAGAGRVDRPRVSGAKLIVNPNEISSGQAVRDVEVVNPAGPAIEVSTGLAFDRRFVLEGVVARGTSGIRVGTAFRVRDTIVSAVGDGDAFAGTTSGVAGELTNVTAIAGGSGSAVALSSTGTAALRNVIARSASGPDISSGSDSEVTVVSSNYADIGGPGSITAPGTGDNQTAAPVFADAEFRQAPESPTIDKGTSDASVSDRDVFGTTAPAGTARDIGAHEFVRAVPPPEESPTPSPTASPSPTATATPRPATTPAPSPTPRPDTCRSTRSFLFRIATGRLPVLRRDLRGARITSATVRQNGRTIRRLRYKNRRTTVNLRGLPRGRFTVQIRVRLRSGKSITVTRRFGTCGAKGPN